MMTVPLTNSHPAEDDAEPLVLTPNLATERGSGLFVLSPIA